MKKLLVGFLLFISLTVIAQKKISHWPIMQKGWYLSFNPFSIVEPEEAGIGIGVGNRFSKRFEAWTELNYLYHIRSEEFSGFDNLKGFRSITSFKYYYSQRHRFFVGADFRLKNYSFDDKTDLINIQTNDTLRSFLNKANHTLIGGAVFWGMRMKLSNNGKLELEGNIGFGGKYRSIKRKNVPAGYTKLEYFNINGWHIIPDHSVEETLPYMPATFRLIYHL